MLENQSPKSVSAKIRRTKESKERKARRNEQLAERAMFTGGEHSKTYKGFLNKEERELVQDEIVGSFTPEQLAKAHYQDIAPILSSVGLTAREAKILRTRNPKLYRKLIERNQLDELLEDEEEFEEEEEFESEFEGPGEEPEEEDWKDDVGEEDDW